MRSSVFAILNIFLLACAFTATPVYAAKARLPVPVKRGPAKTTTSGYSQARLSRGTNSIALSLINLAKVKRVDYTLSYSAQGIEQGVMGSIIPTGQSSDTRDLYFGTCSKGVCTPHRNLKNVVLTVSTALKTGVTSTKRYRVKI